MAPVQLLHKHFVIASPALFTRLSQLVVAILVIVSQLTVLVVRHFVTEVMVPFTQPRQLAIQLLVVWVIAFIAVLV